MQPYIALLGIGCVLNALCAGVIASRDRDRPESGIIAAVHLGAAWWGVCEIAWNLAADAHVALLWIRASALGWVFVGPLILHSIAVIAGGRARLRRAVLPAYAVSAAFLVLALASDGMFTEAVPTSWGFGYRVGGAYVLFYVFTIAAVISGYVLLGSLFGAANLEADRRQRPFVVVGMAVPMVVASTTDVLLPILDVQVPRLGTLSFAVLGALTLSNVIRFGYSLLVPTNFSDEILATLSDGVALLYSDGRIRTANEGLARLAGRTRSELERMDIGDVLEGVPGLPGDLLEAEATLRTQAGARLPVAVTARAVRDRRDNALGRVVSVRDLRELASLRARLATSDRLAAVGQLAAGIAHEINNPLAFVRANLSHLDTGWKQLRASAREAGDIPEADLDVLLRETDELIGESLEGIDRAAEIIRSIRGFSHAGTDEREAANLEELLEQALVMASPRLRGRIRVERRYAGLPRVSCAVQQLKQVFLNLVVNAEQAMDEGGTLRLTTRRVPGPAEAVEVDVEDDGPGIPEAIRERIFDPFFTTKPVGEGTGLGLGIAHEIVRSHGGTIEVDSKPGQGACFRVRLPLDGAAGSR